ncbi:LamG-like jellyroll fold domain-containing protein [Scytonema sp. PCC 10023]|uniref:LamG-like jellyroll fold domain-containing protein n=1 Tax=Scytonema sp. PCC 10023 TaxID=1680591 RepID=UPI0039C6109D
MAKNSQKNQTPALPTVLDFDGQDDFVEIKHNNTFNLPNKFTIEAWVKTKKLSGVQRIFAKFPAYAFGLNGSQIRFTTLKKRDYDTTQAQLAIDTWYHLAVVLDNNNHAHFYLNGELLQTVAGTQPANNSSDSAYIGKNQNGEYWHGSIAELRIWNSIRSKEEIQANKSHRLVGNEPGLVAYWLLDEGTGNTVHDKTSNNNHGTISGNATWAQSELPIQAPVTPTPASETTDSSTSKEVERHLLATGLEDYGFWWQEMLKAQAEKTEPDKPFRRGRIWS